MKEIIKKVRERREGFTMAELLIVVAIIAVLVAIAIPVFTSQLDKSKAATDAANIRSGYAAVQTEVLTTNISSSKNYYLKSDGSVAEATGTTSGAYVTKGDSTKVENGSTIGGLAIGSSGASWTKNQTIYYHVNSDGKVTKINTTNA